VGGPVPAIVLAISGNYSMPHRLILALVLCTSALQCQQACQGAVVAYRFGGKVLSNTPTPWQLSIPFFSSAKGVFSYDTDSPATHVPGDCDCLGYRQPFHNGFFARLGNAYVRVDEYVIEVLNDFPQESGGIADIVTVRFATTYDPPLMSDLIADGQPRSGGDFTLNFRANSNYLSSAALPPSIDFVSYNTTIGFLGDGMLNSPATLFTIETLTAVSLLPGDYDYDNDVDGSDYTIWKGTYSSNANLSADGNHDGLVDAVDYTIWRNSLLNPVSEALELGGFPAPEPGTCVVSALILAGFTLWRRSRSAAIHNPPDQ
jgi:hypothetical protein